MPPSMGKGVTVPALPEIARVTSTQFAVQMVEEVFLPLFVLLRWRLPHLTLGPSMTVERTANPVLRPDVRTHSSSHRHILPYD